MVNDYEKLILFLSSRYVIPVNPPAGGGNPDSTGFSI
jgi:hypothetical protein